MSDKCPKCGSGIQYAALGWFDCGSIRPDANPQSELCKDRQIVRLKAELSEAREFIEEVVQIGKLMREA